MLNYKLDAYFPNETTVAFETSNENIVTINEYGQVTAVAEGFASVTMKVLQDGRSTSTINRSADKTLIMIVFFINNLLFLYFTQI